MLRSSYRLVLLFTACEALILCVCLLGFAATGSPAQDSGKQDYLRYCAGCHGADGKGNGPDYRAIGGPKPPNLTTISSRNGGVFPFQQIEQVVDGRATIPSHKRLDMPFWGVELQTPGQSPNARSNAEVKARIDNIVRYVQSMQRP